MGKSDLFNPLDLISFRCRADGCVCSFSAEPSRVEGAPERDWHPWEYFGVCPECGSDAPQAHWQINLFKGWGSATGPKSEEGKAASAANLDGHPTPEQAHRNRFNALTHGLTARVAKFYPPRPGKYPQCTGCEYLESEGCLPFNACLKKLEIFAQHEAAFESKNPNLLRQLRSDTHASIQSLINEMIYTIALDGGPRMMSPEYYYDKEGKCHFVKYKDDKGKEDQLYKIEAHALLKPLIDFISKNNMTLSDMEMTPKVQDDQALMRGYLDDESNKQNALEYQEKITEQNNKLLQLINGFTPDHANVIEGEVVNSG